MTALLVIIYLSFVGLGLPNSVLGSIWPQMQMELGADVSLVGYLSMTVTAGTVASSVLADRIVCRLGVARVTVISVLMTAGALLGFALSPGVEGLFLCALPMGLAAGAADVALNNFVALHYEAKHMSWLHCFWGIGASIGPMLVAVSLRTGASWRTGYGLISAVVCALCVILICTLPLWGRASGGAGGHQRAAPICVGHIFRRRDVLPLLCGFALYNAMETTAGLWGATFVHDRCGISTSDAALTSTLYFGALTVGRFFAGFAAKRWSDRQLIRAGLGISALGDAPDLVLRQRMAGDGRCLPDRAWVCAHLSRHAARHAVLLRRGAVTAGDGLGNGARVCGKHIFPSAVRYVGSASGHVHLSGIFTDLSASGGDGNRIDRSSF